MLKILPHASVESVITTSFPVSLSFSPGLIHVLVLTADTTRIVIGYFQDRARESESVARSTSTDLWLLHSWDLLNPSMKSHPLTLKPRRKKKKVLLAK